MLTSDFDKLAQEFVTRGMVILSPEQVGVDKQLHQEIYEKEKVAFSNKQLIDASVVPEILQILNAPGVIKACNELIGEDWAIVPFTHNTPFVSGSHDQHWHKDDNGPFNGRRPRYHHSVQLEMLYYPQAVGPLMGPTATIPYSQYWTFNHEENHDNFAGADHLDFQYQINGMERVPVSGPKSNYSEEQILSQSTDHDVRLREAVEKTQWPLMKPFEVTPLEAGSVVLYSHNLFHRGNHRRDGFDNWKANPRFMWRFWLYRTTQKPKIRAQNLNRVTFDDVDELTGQQLQGKASELKAVWTHHYNWLALDSYLIDETLDEKKVSELESNLFIVGEENEPKRIGAAYELASGASSKIALEVLKKGLFEERESVRRAATYGLVGVGPEATDLFMKATESSSKWLRKAGAFGLGEVGEPHEKIIEKLSDLLKNDTSIYVRSVAACALGSLTRRLTNSKEKEEMLSLIINALRTSLRLEENRLSMDRAQERDIKFVRPTDECDVCEGIGINYGYERFSKVRSAVRESALWSLVVVCSQSIRINEDHFESLSNLLGQIIADDENIFSVGFAADALNRLYARYANSLYEGKMEVTDLLDQLPIKPWDSLSRSNSSFIEFN
mgnify:FL=1